MNLLSHVQLKKNKTKIVKQRKKIYSNSDLPDSSMLSHSFQCKDTLSRLARPVYRYARNNDAEAVDFSNMHIKIWLLG